MAIRTSPTRFTKSLVLIGVLAGAFAAVTLKTSKAYAGFIEIGGSGSYRKSNIDSSTTDEARSVTGSVAYYISDASAFELSYTDGLSKREISPGQPYGNVTKLSYRTVGLDFIYTLGKREDSFRPYVKVGANYILLKRVMIQYYDSSGNPFDPDEHDGDTGIVPSGGIGFRVGLTESLAFKAGVDAWASQTLNSGPLTFDFIANVGLSLMF